MLDNTKDKLTKVSESSSVFIAICPVCKSNKLKINLHTGAYSCYSNYCFSKDTYNYKHNKYLLYRQLEVGSNNNIDRFSYSSTVKEYIEPKLITDEVKLATVIKQPKVEVINKSNKVITYFYFSNYQRLERIDYIDKSIKKKCFPQYFDLSSYEWLYGISDVLKPFCSLRYKGECHILTEGCKNAYKVIQRGYSAISFQTYSNEEITNGLKLINPKQLVIIADNDVTGALKANKVKEASWKLSIEAIVIDIKELWELVEIKEDCSSGSDIEDLFNLKPSINLEVLINNYVCSRN